MDLLLGAFPRCFEDQFEHMNRRKHVLHDSRSHTDIYVNTTLTRSGQRMRVTLIMALPFFFFLCAAAISPFLTCCKAPFFVFSFFFTFVSAFCCDFRYFSSLCLLCFVLFFFDFLKSLSL
jgi:hypothetical protein